MTKTYYLQWRGEGVQAKDLNSTEVVKRVFDKLHSSLTGAHCGVQKTSDAITKRFYWPDMTIDNTWVSASDWLMYWYFSIIKLKM